ncbi:hypothetical protein [Dysgonomonas sp. 25]|uniref:hypothetical protein n=1 Tax=Dysgonomonas sp. 25 TaxID=2302933 RepID=UPI0013D251C5|nr:hypothetical protein [Dysgonomonas sp. 25]NDV70033.1 hypothetical protein [Dysgonomonas sp. 25]
MTVTNLLEELLVTTDNSFFLNKITTKAMNYEIIDNPAYTDCVKIGIYLNPDCECLRLFFSSLEINYFTKYIYSVINRESFGGNEFTFLQFYDKMYSEDREELNMSNDDIYNTALSCECILKEKDFVEIFIDYTKRLLEVYSDSMNLNKNWVTDLRDGINKLKDN